MCVKYQSYIQPVGENGIGFFAGGKFYTAGHVVESLPSPRFYSKYPIMSHEYHRYDKKDQYDGTEIDVSIYTVDSVNSPLLLYSMEIVPGLTVECHTWCRKGDEFEYVFVPGKVDVIEGNFFSCIMDNMSLRDGNSGSPLLIGNEVVGILHGGQPGTNQCVFMKILPFIVEKQ